MKKVIFITDQIYKHGGGERVLTNKANFLADNDWAEVIIITSEQKSRKACYSLTPKVKIIDLNINYNRNLSYFNPFNFKKLPVHLYRLRKVLNSLNPDVIITLSTQFDFYFLPFLKKRKSKIIREYHSSRFFYWQERLKSNSFQKKLLYKFSDYVEKKYDYLVVLTKDEKEYFHSKNVKVIPNYLSSFPSESTDLSNLSVISVGRLAPVKGYDRLLKIWGEINKWHPNWILKIYGDGEPTYKNYLNQLIKELNLTESVFQMGNTDDVYSALQESSVYAMTSTTECFPMVLLEAQSCGLPIIAFDCPNGPRNIITDMIDGFLIPEKNTDEFKLKLSILMKEKSTRVKLGNAGFMNVKSYTEKIIMSKWNDSLNLGFE